jgi:hypothetical protein
LGTAISSSNGKLWMSSSGIIHIEGMEPKMMPSVRFKRLRRDEIDEDVKKGVRNESRRLVIICDAKA